MQHFRIRGLPADRFEPLFRLSDAEIAARHARRMIVDGPGYPCRISLTDASPGDTVVLFNYEHHAVNSPFRSSFGIYIRQGERTFDAVDEVPQQLRSRVLSLRGYDEQGFLRRAELVDGAQIESGIAMVFGDAAVAYVHAHFAKHGCYAALIERA